MEKKDFRIVFMGTPDFAVESLKALVENGFNIVGVITSPDKPAGRGQKIHQSPVKQYALGQGLNILQPTNLKDETFLAELKSLEAQLQIIVAFRMLPEKVWNMPPMGSLNLHGSLLPHYRGAAPINHAVMNGEKESGVTTFFLKHAIDTGDIIFREKCPIGENETAGELHDKLMEIGAQLIVKTANAVLLGDYEQVPQDSIAEEALKQAPKIFKETCRINWNQSVGAIHNHIRGLSPYPAAWTELTHAEKKNMALKIFVAKPANKVSGIGPGKIETDGKTYLKIATEDEFLEVEEVQLAGKKRMDVKDFLRGFQGIEHYIAK
jgi:methionyl-tRNA formyltransferase